MSFQPPAVDEIEQDQPKFTPPAPSDIDLDKSVQLTPYDKYKLAVSQGATPENYAEIGLPPALNPDYDFPRQAGVVPYVSKGLAALQEHVIEPTAAKIFSTLKQATAMDVPVSDEQRGKGVAGVDLAPIEPGKPMLSLPRLTPQEMEGATSGEKIAAGIGEGLAGVYEGFSTPGNVLMLPFAEMKPVQAYYGAQMAAGIPESMKAIGEAKTPQEQAKAYTSLAANLGMGALMAHSAMSEGGPRASKNTEATPVHGDVRSQPIDVQAQVSTAEGGAGVQPKSKVSLSPGFQPLIEPHLEKYNGVVLNSPETGQVMRANHETGQIEINKTDFEKWVMQDLKDLTPHQMDAAIKSAFEHEDIHLKTDPEDAEPFWNSLSDFEQWVFSRNYLKGQPMQSPRNMGFEAIRNRVERAMGLTRNDFVGLALKERWTAKSLDALADVVGKIRRLRDKELSAHQKDILDKVLDNIDAARNAVPTGEQKDKQEYVEGPFMQRQAEPEEGKVRLFRGHDGSNGGVYWTKDLGYAQRMGPKVEFLDVPKDQLADHSVRKAGSGTPNAFKLPADMTKAAQDFGPSQVPVHDLGPAMMRKADDLLEHEPGETSVAEVVNLNDAEAQKFFEGNQKRGNAIQHDAVLQGMKLGVESIPELTKMRDQMHKVGMEKLEKAFGPGGDGKAPSELGKVIWLNGVLEGAARKGPNYESVVTRRREQAPAMMRKKNKPGEQPEMFGAVTERGVPGGEDVQPVSASKAGALEFTPDQKIFPQEIDWQEKAKSPQKSSLPVRPITASEAKNATELSKFLTEDARKEGSDLPVSVSRRLTVLFDKTDGTVHMVSTYRGDGVARMVDPEIAGKERNSRPVGELLHRYEPIASVLLREPKQGFHQKFDSMAEFRQNFGDEAAQMFREHSTGTEGIPMTSMARTPVRDPDFKGMAQQPAENFRMPSEREPNLVRPTTEELKAFHDFFGDTPPSDALMFSRRIETQAANASRAMISGIRKMVRMERAQTRGLSEGEALGRVLDRLYENFSNSETRSEFVQRTMEQGRIGAPEEISSGRPAETFFRDLSTLRSRAPTTVAGAKPGTGAPMPEGVPPSRTEMLSAEEQQALNAEVRKHHPPQFRVNPRTTLGMQVLETPVPKQPYSIGKTRPITKVEYVDPETGETYEQPYRPDDIKTEEDLEKEREEEEKKQLELMPERELRSETPPKPKPKESLVQEKKAVAKGEGAKAQLDFWKKQGPAMMRKAEDTVDKVKDYLARTGANVKTAGELSDQLYRLKTSEKADYDLALPVIKSALKIIPESDRPTLLKYADEMQVLKRSDIQLTDAQERMYQTFLKPLLDDNQKMYRSLMRAGVPVGESTYLGRMVQDTHSLYNRLWQGTKQRITEGSILGQGASFFKRRVFKALEGSDGTRRLIALVGDGKDTRVIGYEKGKGELLGKMPPESLEAKPLTAQQLRTQRIVEARRLQALDKLDKEEQALLKEKARLGQSGNSDPAILKEIDDRLASINGDYAEVAETYPSPVFDIPRMWKDKNGKTWRFTDATIDEIEKNTNTRYYQEPMSGVITQNLKLKQIYRANAFLEDLKNSADFQRISRSTNERNVPADWRTVDLPQFRGLRIEPRTADVLDLFAQEQKGPSLPLKYVTNLTSFLRNSLFVWNPFVHEPNLLAHWFTARGVEWMNPAGYARMVKSGVQSLNDVMTRSQFRDEALRSGAPLLRGMGNINRQVMMLLRKELEPNPSIGTKLARGLGYINPLRMIRAFGDSLTWGTNEVLTLQLLRETMERTGLSMEDAVAEVGKHMPNYRVPPRVLNSRLISHVMRNPLLTLWGHYHYGALRSYGEMGKEIFSPSSSAKTRMEGLGRVATIGFLMAVVYPVIDDIVNKVLHTKGLKMRRAGSATVPQNLMELARGKKTPEAVAQSILTPSPVAQGAAELMFNRNLRTGLPVYERRLGEQTLKDLGSFAANKVSPIEEGGRVFGGKKSLEEFGLGLAGVTRTRADSAMSQFGRMADNWMRTNPDESIREEYKRRTQDVFQESEYQILRSAIIRQDRRAAQMAVDKLLKTRKPEEVDRRIKQWKDSPFTGTRKTDKALMEEMTPKDWGLWYQAAQERLDIADGMRNALVDALVKSSDTSANPQPK